MSESELGKDRSAPKTTGEEGQVSSRASSLENPGVALEGERLPGPSRRLRMLVFQVYVLIALLAFLLLAFLASSQAYFPIDLVITKALQALSSDWFASLMRLVSWPGYGPQVVFVVALVVFLLYRLGLHLEAIFSAAIAAGVQALTFLVKIIVRRPRPSEDIVEVIRALSDFSFPSGHVSFYTGFFGFLLFLSFSLLKPSWKRTLLILTFGMLVALIGPSRIYLGEHWASDVLGGYLLGSICLLVAIWIYRRRKKA